MGLPYKESKLYDPDRFVDESNIELLLFDILRVLERIEERMMGKDSTP